MANCAHAATHIVYIDGRQWIICTHCGTRVG